ncbi:zona pellucida sperm-binding protein 4-like [Protopterus annectens]|uniref:zona pellucida sperm-binding protein 4-like n=1 Tax=Protopterus annectens TaxID=7888 RepID=UPI001CFC326D|nr:zona pellucida sperm-binding protein 4-like [Protopterus annectens]
MALCGLSLFLICVIGNDVLGATPESERTRFRGYRKDIICGSDHMVLKVQHSAFADIRFKVGGVSYGIHDPAARMCNYKVTREGGATLFVVLYNGCHVRKVQNGRGFSAYTLKVKVEGVGKSQSLVVEEEILMSCSTPKHTDWTAKSQQKSALSLDESCSVDTSKRLHCGEAGIGQLECKASSCCYDPIAKTSPCYYGNTVTVECTKDAYYLIVVSRNVTVPSLVLDSIHMAVSDPGCLPERENADFLLFRVPFTSCGTTYMADGDYHIYENELVADRTLQMGPKGVITRDSTFRLTIQCVYNGADVNPLQVQIYTVAPPPPATDSGPLHLQLRIAKDSFYGSYYTDKDFPVVKLLREPVYVEVRILERTDPDLVLVLENCWGTPTSDPSGIRQWDILVAGCPYTGDNYISQLQTVDASSGLQFPKHYRRFVVKTFIFIDDATQMPLQGQVYFHCSAAVCVPNGKESCEPSCNSFRSRSKREREDVYPAPLEGIVTSLPLIFSLTPDGYAVDPVEGYVMVPQENHLPNSLTGILAIFGAVFVFGGIALIAKMYKFK